MKRLLIALIMTFGLTFAFAGPVSAAGTINVINDSDICKKNPDAEACKGSESATNSKLFGSDGLLTRVARLIAIVVGMASMFMLLIGGFKYITSSGDPSNVKSAKDTILFAIVGVLITVSAQSIIILVLNKL